MEAKRGKARRPMIVGTKMRCPRCKGLHNLLQYVPLMQIEEFESETNTIYKCPSCRWIFSPSEHVAQRL